MEVLLTYQPPDLLIGQEPLQSSGGAAGVDDVQRVVVAVGGAQYGLIAIGIVHAIGRDGFGGRSAMLHIVS